MILPPRLLAAPAFGAAMALGQAPLGWWWATLLAGAGVFALLPRVPRAAMRWLWLAGAGHFGAALLWIVQPFFINPVAHGWMAPFALVLMAGGMALFWAGAGLVARFGPAMVAVAFLALELLRGWVFTGFPWAMLGHVLIDTPLVQLASLGGAGLLSALVLVAMVVPAQASLRGRAIGSTVALALVAGGWGWGLARMPDTPASQGPQGPVVRLVQPNAPQEQKWDQDRAVFFFERMLAQTASLGPAPPDLVIWPETSVPFLLSYPGAALILMADAASMQGPDTTIAFGVQRLDAGRYYNSLALLDTAGRVGQVYDKHHLVPFGEYIPFADWIAGSPVGGLAAQALQGYSAGPGPRLLDLGPLGRALPLICYEAIFPRHTRTATRPDWLLHVTNDAWFGTLSGPYQHLAQARLRAVEQGLPLLRSANTGISAGFDGYGRPLGSIALGVDGFLDIALPPPLPPTPYARWGDGPLWVLLAALALGIAAARRVR